LEHDFYFPYIGNVIIPTDELIFFRGVGIPPTRYDLTRETEDLTRWKMDKKMVSFYQLTSQILAGWFDEC